MLWTIAQVFAALIVGVLYYMLAVILTIYDGILSLILQPIAGAFFSGLAIAFLLVLGLPIRLSKKLHAWWRVHWWIAPALLGLATLMIVASWLPLLRAQYIDPEWGTQEESFNQFLAPVGWLLTLFAILHFYLPTNTHKAEAAVQAPTSDLS